MFQQDLGTRQVKKPEELKNLSDASNDTCSNDVSI